MTLLFDGGSFNTLTTYWVSRAMLSREEESIKIFRMLDCGAINALGFMPDKQQVDLMNYLINSSETDGKKKLNELKLDTNKFYCTPNAVLLLSNRIALRVLLMEKYVNWNFNTNSYNKYVQGAFTRENGCTKNKNNITCGDILINTDAKTAKTKDNTKVPVILITKNMSFAANTVNSSAVYLVYEDKYGLRYTGMSSYFLDSVFVRAFFLNGWGLKHYKIIADDEIPYRSSQKVFWMTFS